MRNASAIVVLSAMVSLGSVLGASSTASAGLTWNAATGDNYVSIQIGVDESLLVTGSAAMDAVSFAFGGDSLAVTAASASGFSASMNATGSHGANVDLGRHFSVTGSVDISIWGTATSDVSWRIYDMVNMDEFGNPEIVLQLDLSGGAVYSQAITLGSGQYAVSLAGSLDVEASYSGTFGNFTLVPAPGAITLLGAAGMIASRRRKA